MSGVVGAAPPRRRKGAAVADGPGARAGEDVVDGDGDCTCCCIVALGARRGEPAPAAGRAPPERARTMPVPSRLAVGLMRAERGSSGLLPGVRARAAFGEVLPEPEGTRGRALARDEAVGVVRPRPVVGSATGTVGCCWIVRVWVGEREGRERVRERAGEVEEGDALGAGEAGAAREERGGGAAVAALLGVGTRGGDMGREEGGEGAACAGAVPAGEAAREGTFSGVREGEGGQEDGASTASGSSRGATSTSALSVLDTGSAFGAASSVASASSGPGAGEASRAGSTTGAGDSVSTASLAAVSNLRSCSYSCSCVGACASSTG